MLKILTLILVVISLVACSGCYWGGMSAEEGTRTTIAEAMTGKDMKIAEVMMVIGMTTMETMTIIKAMNE